MTPWGQPTALGPETPPFCPAPRGATLRQVLPPVGGRCLHTANPPLLTRALALQTVQDGRQFLSAWTPGWGSRCQRGTTGNCLIYDADNKSDPFHNVWVSARESHLPGLTLWGLLRASLCHILGVKPGGLSHRLLECCPRCGSSGTLEVILQTGWGGDGG